MKKLLLCMALISVMPLLGRITYDMSEYDIHLSPEERAIKQTNDRKKYNEMVENARNKDIEEATHNFINNVTQMKNINDRDAEVTKFVKEITNIRRRHQELSTGSAR